MNSHSIQRQDKSSISLLDAAYDHLDYVLRNPELFRDPVHFSTVQYSNVTMLHQLNHACKDIFNSMARLRRGSTYLNIGTGPGLLEFYCKQFKLINMDSVEWDEQVKNFSVIRKALDVEPDYLCNDITADNFEIYNCEKKYDYVVLVRFFPLNKDYANLDQVKERLAKFKPYADHAIIIDNIDWTFTHKVYQYLETLDMRTLPDLNNGLILDLSRM